MVAIPCPPTIETDEKQVRTLQRPNPHLRVIVASQRIAERGAEATQDRCLYEKRAHSYGLPVKYLVKQIVKHKGVTAGERGDILRDLCGILALERQRRELEAG